MEQKKESSLSFNSLPSWNQQSFRRYAQKLEPLLKKPQNRVYTATILSFLVISLFLWYAIRPTMQTIFSLRREIADKTVVSKQMEDKISAIVQANATYQAAFPRLNLLEQALPQEPAPVPVLFSIRELARSIDATVSALILPKTELAEKIASISGSAPPANTPESFTITVTVDGNYEQIKQFLQGLLNLRRIISIEQIRITTPDTDLNAEQQKSLRLITQIRAYYHPGGNL